MKNKVFITIICITITLFISSIIYVSIGTSKAEKLIKNYLTEKGNKQNEIQNINVKHSFLNIILSYQEWTIEIIYKDEPTSIYYYHMNENKITEGGVTGSTIKEDLKHAK